MVTQGVLTEAALDYWIWQFWWFLPPFLVLFCVCLFLFFYFLPFSTSSSVFLLFPSCFFFSLFKLLNVCCLFCVIFLFCHFFSSSQLSVPIFFLFYSLPSLYFLFVYFLVSLVVSTETITSQIPVPHCLLFAQQTFSCCIFISLVPDFMVFDQEFVEVQLRNLLWWQSNFSEVLYSL